MNQNILNDLETSELLLDGYERWNIFPINFDPNSLYIAWLIAKFGDPED